MQANELTTERLRRLAGTTVQDGKVLSVFVNLDPREFATPPARESQVRSVLDRAEKEVREAEGLSHDERKALREDLERVSSELRNGLDAKGAHALAVFACSPAGLFEVVKLPQPVDHAPVVSDGPCLEPITEQASSEKWAVVLANRRTARLFIGTRDRLEEVEAVEDDVPGQHQQGGWSQARYQRSVDEEVQDHIRNVAAAAWRRLGEDLPVGILVGAPSETAGDVEAALHPYLRSRLVGRLEIDVENTRADDVFELAREHIARHARGQEDEVLERLREGLGRPDGRAVAGLPDVLRALQERRVEALLVEHGFHAAGSRCRQCEMLHVETGGQCPADGAALEPVEDVVAPALEAAIGQDASVHVLHERPELGPHGHVAAVTRF